MGELVNLERREMLRATTGMLTGLVVAGSPLAVLARGAAWAVDLHSLDSPQGAALLAMTRTICPHDKLEDAAYAMVVRALDEEAAKNDGTKRMLNEGLAQLGTGFAEVGETERVVALTKIESSPFFQAVRLKTVQVLYATPMAYAHFGYEGEAFSKGGYLYRGFNDLRWLPEVPAEDSGPMPGKE